MHVTETELQTQNGRFAIFQVGDMHADLLSFDARQFTRFTQFVQDYFDRGNSGVVIFQGDYVHGRLPGDKFYSSKILRPEVAASMDDYAGFMAEYVGGLIKPFVRTGAPVYCLRGNHDEYVKHVDVAKLIATCGGAEYAGDEMMLRIRARDQYQKAKTLRIYAAHGAGGGSLPGSKLNKLVKSPRIVEADAYLFGHLHDSVFHIDQVPFIPTDGKAELRMKERLYSYTSSFVAGRSQGVFDYPGKKSLPAVNAAKYLFTADTWNDCFGVGRVL